MGAEDSKPPPPPPTEPPKTVKEMTKEAKKGLDQMIREFKRETFRLELDSKKLKKDQEKAVKKGEPATTQRIYAQNYLKKQAMINKYKGLEAKIEGVKISLANIATTQALVDCMGNMSDIMGKTAKNIDINNIQTVITNFNTQYEKQNIISEMVEDAMDVEDDIGDDTAADELIDNVAAEKGVKKQGNLMGEQNNFDNEQAGLKDM